MKSTSPREVVSLAQSPDDSCQLRGREQASRQAFELVPGEGQEDGGELVGHQRHLHVSVECVGPFQA